MYINTKNRCSSGYVCTVDANDPRLPDIIATIKHQVKVHNLQERLGEVLDPKFITDSWRGKQEVRKRAVVRVRGRLGKKNPNAELYRVGGKLHTWTSQDIKLEHAQRVDIYVQERRDYIQVK